MTAHAEPSKDRRTVLVSPSWGNERTCSGPAPWALVALGALASGTCLRVRSSTLGGPDPVVWTGTREQFVAPRLIPERPLPWRPGAAYFAGIARGIR